jgi:hypothetical protein
MPIRRAGAAMMPMADVLVFSVSKAEIVHPKSPLPQANFSGFASQLSVPDFFVCLQGTTQCRPCFRMFYCQPFKGKPGASRGRKASGL